VSYHCAAALKLQGIEALDEIRGWVSLMNAQSIDRMSQVVACRDRTAVDGTAQSGVSANWGRSGE
jgi:hypothetical protein